MGVDLGSGEKSVAARIAHFLKLRGVSRVFGLQGGHIQPIWDWLGRLDMPIVDVRDEGAAVHMAHAYGELTGELHDRHGDSGAGRHQLRDRDRQCLARENAAAPDRRLPARARRSTWARSRTFRMSTSWRL